MSDVLIVGAGIAGLTAALELARKGLKVTIFEARERIGGRIFTGHDPNTNLPVELGAEFIHGRPPEIWGPIHDHHLKTHEVDGDPWCVRENQLRRCDFFNEVDDLLAKMDDSHPDESFLDFLSHYPDVKPQTRDRAISYVSGFNAADAAGVSVQWLVQSRRADEKIEGDRAFRLDKGYESFVDIFRLQLSQLGVPVHLNTIVKNIRWKQSRVEVVTSESQTFTASKSLITVPLAILQVPDQSPAAISFDPALPVAKCDALLRLKMGAVIRISLVFRERFWGKLEPQPGKTLEDMSFLFSPDDVFPTWWTSSPRPLPIITGWSPADHAGKLSGQDASLVSQKALKVLSRLLNVQKAEIERLLIGAYTHDWQCDPFSLGAYTYVKVGGSSAPRELGAPVDNTLFFAGEATDVSGHTGTVHGAIASANRAITEILQA